MAKTTSIFLTQVEDFLTKTYGEAESKTIIQSAWARYEEICTENKDEPTEMYIHTRERIYPAILVGSTLFSSFITTFS